MALYRTVSVSFWNDPKVDEEFTPEDKYFFLYLMTNPHTNLCGCYEISVKTMSKETGYSQETITRLIERFEAVHQVISFNPMTKEVLLFNWHKYNWTASEKYRKPLKEQIDYIKSKEFRDFLTALFNGEDTVSIPYRYPIDTVSIPYGYRIDTSSTNTNTNTSANANSISNTNAITTSNASSIRAKNQKEEQAELINNSNFSVALKDALFSWLSYKSEKKQCYKPTGFKAFLTKINSQVTEFGEQAVIDAISDSMANNYSGIFPKKSAGGSAYMDAIKNRIEVVDSWV